MFEHLHGNGLTMGKRSFFLGVIVVPLALWVALMVVQLFIQPLVTGEVVSALAQLVLLIFGGWLL